MTVPAAVSCVRVRRPAAPQTVSSFGALLIVVTVGLLVPSARAGHPLPELLGSGVDGTGAGLLVRPAEILYTGDGSGELGGFDGTGKNGDVGHLRWSSWTRKRAFGTGAVWLDDCTPNCAAGRFSPHAVKVRVFRPIGVVFTRLTLSYTDAGRTIVDRRTLEQHGGSWGYGAIVP